MLSEKENEKSQLKLLGISGSFCIAGDHCSIFRRYRCKVLNQSSTNVGERMVTVKKDGRSLEFVHHIERC
jgi:hypothetical protein